MLRRDLPNKPLVPTRNGEAPLLAAQRRRWVPVKTAALANVLVWVLASMTFPALANGHPSDPKLAAYCADARKSDAAIVDPTQVPKDVSLARARVTEVLGQKVQAASRRLGLEGTLLVGLVVGKDGRTRNTRVLESSGHRSLDREAIDIVGTALFVPARLNQREVAECKLLQVTFKLM